LLTKAINHGAVKRAVKFLDTAHSRITRLHRLAKTIRVELHIRGGRERKVERRGLIARSLFINRQRHRVIAAGILRSGVVIAWLISVDTAELDFRAKRAGHGKPQIPNSLCSK